MTGRPKRGQPGVAKEVIKEIILFLPKLSLVGPSANTVNAYWWQREKIKNFGDLLTPYLIEKLSGKRARRVNEYCVRPYYIVAGSVIGKANRNAIVWGAGLQKKDERIKRPKQILAVRGPLTRARLLALGYQCEAKYGDPALLLPRFYKPRSRKEYKFGVVPHYVDYQNVKAALKGKDILVIDVLKPVEEVIDDIGRCEKMISSSLHGLMVSHVYDIPSLWVEFSDGLAGDGVKFEDYLLAVGLPAYAPVNLKSGAALAALGDDFLTNLFNRESALAKPDRRVIERLAADLMSVCPFAQADQGK